jgi:hypothetical protein
MHWHEIAPRPELYNYAFFIYDFLFVIFEFRVDLARNVSLVGNVANTSGGYNFLPCLKFNLVKRTQFIDAFGVHEDLTSP